MGEDERAGLESRIDRWRTYVAERSGAPAPTALEERLRSEVAGLLEAGLGADEAFIVALRRVSADDATSRGSALAFATELLGASAEVGGAEKPEHSTKIEFVVMLGCAIAAALAVKLPALLGYEMNGPNADFYMRNVSLLVLPFLAAYFAWKRGLSAKVIAGIAAIFALGAVFANVYPFTHGGATEALTAIHLPIVLWLATGVAYAGGSWTRDDRRMEYARFTGEWLINYTLIALGGGVLIALTTGIFEALGVDVSRFIAEWVLPCGAAGAVIVAAWMAGLRRNPVGGLAPMLARVFTPLFALMLVGLLAGVAATRGVINLEREALILLDLLLVVVLALLLHAISARDPLARPGVLDRLQLVLVGSALVVDVVALLNIAVRLSEYGFSPNRTAALGLNLILLVNLAWSAVAQTRYLAGRGSFVAIARWQMRYLPVFALWAAIVVVSFPLLFGFA